MYLITGGSGFIGSHFHNYLPNHELINLDINEPAFNQQSIFIKGDIRKESDVRNAIKGNNIKSIISLAAKHHDFGIGHDEYFDTNEDGTRILCQVASEFNISEIIFYSSVAVYGIREEVSSEQMMPKPDSPYGASKLAGEKVLEEWAKQDPKRKVLIIRPTLVFGTNNRANMFNLIRQIDSGFYFHLGKADNIKSLAYVENLVSCTLFLRDKMTPGCSIYNYADEPQLTTREIATTIADYLGKKIKLTLPRSVGIMLGLPFDALIKITRKNLPISSSRIKKLGTSTHHSAKKVFSLGFVPKFSVKDGLKVMVAWYQSQRD
jgi:GlcNAc-P-P-Und epimerase